MALLLNGFRCSCYCSKFPSLAANSKQIYHQNHSQIIRGLNTILRRDNKRNTEASLLSRNSVNVAQTVVADDVIEQKDAFISKEVINEVNEQINTKTHGRLFAVVHISGKQFKITDHDIIVIQGYFVPRVGEKIRLEKVLLVGGSDFTLIGRPLLNKDLVRIDATVIEKTLSHPITHFFYVRRKRVKRIKFNRIPQTMLRINSIKFRSCINEIKDVEGLDERII